MARQQNLIDIGQSRASATYANHCVDVLPNILDDADETIIAMPLLQEYYDPPSVPSERVECLRQTSGTISRPSC